MASRSSEVNFTKNYTLIYIYYVKIALIVISVSAESAGVPKVSEKKTLEIAESAFL